jgi:hypothetical protein
MFGPILTAALVFILVFALLRAAEWSYHHFRRTPDWSPHWGSWVFALLAAVFALVSELGR